MEAGGDIWQPILGMIVSLFVGGGGVSWYTAHKSAKAQVSGDEREARRDTIADRDAFIQSIMHRLEAVEERLDAEQEQRRREGAVSQARSDWIDRLEHHINTQKPPPAPPRPEGI